MTSPEIRQEGKVKPCNLSSYGMYSVFFQKKSETVTQISGSHSMEGWYNLAGQVAPESLLHGSKWDPEDMGTKCYPAGQDTFQCVYLSLTCNIALLVWSDSCHLRVMGQMRTTKAKQWRIIKYTLNRVLEQNKTMVWTLAPVYLLGLPQFLQLLPAGEENDDAEEERILSHSAVGAMEMV